MLDVTRVLADALDLTADDDLRRDHFPRARPKGFAPWKPHVRKRRIRDAVVEVLARRSQPAPMTNRQILYRLIGVWPGRFSKADEQAVEDVVQRGRRAGMIAWEDVDDGRSVERPPFEFADAEEFRRWVAVQIRRAQLPRQGGQPFRIELFVETEGLVPLLQGVAHPFGVGVFSSSGTSTTTAIYRAFVRAWNAFVDDKEADREPRRSVVLFVSDLDPKGVELFNTFRIDLERMCADEGQAGLVEVHRIGLVPAQVARYGVESEPHTAKDLENIRLGKLDWPAGRPRAQVEALSQEDLAAEVRTALEALTDAQARSGVVDAEGPFRRELIDQLGLDGDV